MQYTVSTVFKGIDHMSGTMDKIQRKAGGLAGHLEAGFNTAAVKLERMNSAIRGATVSAVAWGTAYALPLASIYKSGAAVEDQLVRAFTKLDESVPLGSARFKQLQEQIAATTKGTEVFQVQAAEAFQELAGAGYNAEKSLGSLVNVYDAARFSQMGLGEQAVRIVDAMKMFNLESKDATTNTNNMRKAMNQLALADMNSTSSVTQLYEAIQNGGAKAAEFGTDLETYLAMVTNFNSLKGFEAGTGAKQIFNKLIPTEATVRAVYKYLEVDVADKKGRLLDPLTILKNLSDKLATKTEYEGAQALKLIFGMEGTAPSIFMKEIKKLYPDIVKFRQELRENKRDILGQFGEQSAQTAKGRWERFLKNFDDRKQKLFEPLKPKVIEAFDKAEAWMTANNDKIVEVMNKMINYLPDLATAALTIAENLPGLIKAVLALKAAELGAKGIRGGAGMLSWLDGMLFGTPKAGSLGAAPKGGTPGPRPGGHLTRASEAKGLAGWMQNTKIGRFLSRYNEQGAAMAGMIAYAEVNKSPAQRKAERDAGWWETTKAAAGLRSPIEPQVTTGTDRTSMGKDINIRVFTNEPRLKAELMPAGFSQSSLLLPTSGGF